MMAAMRTSSITKAIVEPLYWFGTKVWGIITSAPGNMPVFGGQSANSMGSAASTIGNSLNTMQSTKWTKLAQDKFWYLMWNEKSKEMQLLSAKIPNNAIEWLDLIWKVMSKLDSAQDIANDKSARTTLYHWLKTLDWQTNLSADEYKKQIEIIRDSSDANEIKQALSKLDTNANNWYSILDWDNKVSEWDIDTAIKDTTSSNVKNNTKSDIKLNITNIDKKLDKWINETEAKSIAIQLMAQGINGHFTKTEFKKELEKLWITDNKDIQTIITEIDTKNKENNEAKKRKDPWAIETKIFKEQKNKTS
jgi:hypothetical protein